MKKLKSKKLETEKDIDLLPIMNLFSILIPVLLTMAVFHKVAIVDLNMPEQSPDNSGVPQVRDDKLNLTLALTKDYVSIISNDGQLPRHYYKEIVEVKCNNDKQSIKYERATKNDLKCAQGDKASIHDIEKFHLLALNKTSEEDVGSFVKVVKIKEDSVLLNPQRKPIQNINEVKVGSVYQTLDIYRSIKIQQKNKSELSVSPITVNDLVSLELQEINQRFVDFEDGDEIQIVADQDIEYDKIIQMMDLAKQSGFAQINLGQIQE